MTDENLTLFQQLVNNEEASQMIEDLRDLDELIPEGERVEDIQAWEMAVSFDETDVPRMIEELEELVDDEP